MSCHAFRDNFTHFTGWNKLNQNSLKTNLFVFIFEFSMMKMDNHKTRKKKEIFAVFISWYRKVVVRKIKRKIILQMIIQNDLKSATHTIWQNILVRVQLLLQVRKEDGKPDG